MNHESGRALGWELANAREQISEGLRERLEFGLSQSEAAVAEARAVFDRAQREFPADMEGLDALVTPSAPGQAPAGLEWTGDPAFNLIWTSLHVPCVTVPAGTGPDGLPLGIQIVDADRRGPAGAGLGAVGGGGDRVSRCRRSGFDGAAGPGGGNLGRLGQRHRDVAEPITGALHRGGPRICRSMEAAWARQRLVAVRSPRISPAWRTASA